MKIKRISVDIEWVRDPDAEDYQMPCDDCPDFCDREDTDEATGEDFGEAYCYGQTLVRRTTRWAATLEFSWRSSFNSPLCVQEVVGYGQSEDEALTNAQVDFAAQRLREDSFDVPESSVRLRPCRSS